MSKVTELLYSPALRMKTGELNGVSKLAPDVADHILPRFIVPPSGKRDDAAPLLMDLDRMPDISVPLAGAWQHRPALIDASYVLSEFGGDQVMRWLPEMFRRARAKEVMAIPAAYLEDIEHYADAYKASIDKSAPIKFGVIVTSDEISEVGLSIRTRSLLERLDISASDSVVVVDFANVEFSEPEIVAPIIGFSLETLQEVGLWQKIIFQGSHYPDKNPAPREGGFEVVARNEWVAWRLAVKFDPNTADHMVFGDYAADCSKIEFGDGGGKPICHVRFTIGENWRVERGPVGDKDRESMHKVYNAIVQNVDFPGADFSQADAYIATAAFDLAAPHGNGTTWRQLNTTHHITQIVRDIAKVRGINIKPFPASKPAKTETLF